jgi:hypothetical protein
MTKLVALSIFALAAGILLAAGVYSFAEAQGADAAAALDAATNPAARIPAVPAPTDDPGWFVSRVGGLWRSGAIPSAVILGLFGVLSILRAKLSWFAKGRQAVIVAAVLGTLTMLVGDIVAGSSPNLSMYMSALLAGVMLYIKGEAQPPKVST